MPFGPDIREQISRARTDLRMGVPVVLRARQDALLIPAETLLDQRLKELHNISDDILLVLTAKRALTLKIGAYDKDLVRLNLSSEAELDWIKAVANPSDDLKNPLKGPFQYKREGEVRIERLALSLVKSAQLLPAAVIAYVKDTETLIQNNKLTVLDIEETAPLLSEAVVLTDIVSANLPIAAAEMGKLHIFRPKTGAEEHYAMTIGNPSPSKPVLVRIHSACFTGDVLGSLKCDCGIQLQSALTQMGQSGSGILLYLNQEGRGIGLANKMRAYSLQNEGFDTVEANHRLGFEDAERDFRLASSILKDLNISKIQLMTNNPAKILMMERNHITVSNRVALITDRNEHNEAYMDTKAKKSGHLL